MNQNKVTVVTVTYNAEELLESTILSVINQSYSNMEYIIIDGASLDNTIEIIKKYDDKIDYWISEPDEGIYFAMNKAIEQASGEWMNFMNAGDTFVDKDTIQKVMDSLEEDTEIIYGDHICDGVMGSVSQRKITRTMPCCHQSLFVKTALMKKYPYNTFYKISSDYDFLLQMYLKGKKFQYLQQPIAHYLRNGFSDQNESRWYLEVLTVLMNNNIDLDEIIKSPAYNLIENNKLTHLQKNYNTLQKKYEDIEDKYKLLIESFTNMVNIKTFKNPIKKFKMYKKLLSLYVQQSKKT